MTNSVTLETFFPDLEVTIIPRVETGYTNLKSGTPLARTFQRTSGWSTEGMIVETKAINDGSTNPASTAYADNTFDKRVQRSAKTANYTAVNGDQGKTIEMNVGSANTFTVPANSSVPFAVGSILNVAQIGAGATTIAAAGGVTIRNRSGLKLAGQYAKAFLYMRAADEWIAYGELTT